MFAYDRLEKLVATFARDVGLAKKLDSPNAGDDVAIEAAAVGFSYNSPTEQWAIGHHDFVKTRLDRDFSVDALPAYGDNGHNVRLFFALGIGFLLGLYQQGEITDHEFAVEEMRLSGLIMLHLPELTARPI